MKDRYGNEIIIDKSRIYGWKRIDDIIAFYDKESHYIYEIKIDDLIDFMLRGNDKMNDKVIELKNRIREDMKYLRTQSKAYARIVIEHIDNIFGDEIEI